MEQKNKEQQTITPDQKKMFLKKKAQSQVRLDLVTKEKNLRVELQNIKNKYNTIKEGTKDLEFMYRPEYFDTILKLEEVSLEAYLINANDEIDKLEREVKGMDKLLSDAIVKEEEIPVEVKKDE